MEVAAAAKQLLPATTMPPPRDPNSPSSSSTSSSSPSSAPSPSQQQQQQPSPRPVPRIIETTPFPTTFVQADTASFKKVVQMLTGSDAPPQKPANKTHHHHHHGNGGVPCRPKKPAFKLYERRSGLKNLKLIAPLARKAPPPYPEGLLSPSVLDFPSLALASPVTPLLADPFNRSPASPAEEAEAVVARDGFFLHPSPRSAGPPRLLPLFPVTSPRMTASSAAATPSAAQY